VKGFRLTFKARDDLFDIWTYIARHDGEAADRLETQVMQACEQLANRPDLGHFRRDLTDKPVRFYAVHTNYLLVYDPATEPIEILRILHGARDAPRQLGD
jgi:plasmid stabilization system protein ParE